MYIWRRTLIVTIDAKKWLEVSKTWGLRYQIVLEFMLGISHLWKHIKHYEWLLCEFQCALRIVHTSFLQ